MRYHKIKGVDLSTCTAEAKIAYNFASMRCGRYLPLYNKAETAAEKQQIIYLLTNSIIDELRYNIISGIYKIKVDIDGVQCCLNYGLDEYMKQSTWHGKILTSYEEIGAIFKSQYLEA